MKEKIQWKIELMIEAPIELVWELCEDITLIPKWHPRVEKVELVSGVKSRAEGVAYKCHFKQGSKDSWCVEHITEYVPHEKMTITVPEDSIGLGKLFQNFRSELFYIKNKNRSTTLRLENFYDPIGLKGKVVNIFFKSKMRKQAMETFIGLKKMIEKDIK